MEALVFCGVQATGRTTYCARHFLHTHVRIGLDRLRTRHRERRSLNVRLETQTRVVIDNTNPTRDERARYVGPARAGIPGRRLQGSEPIRTPRSPATPGARERRRCR